LTNCPGEEHDRSRPAEGIHTKLKHLESRLKLLHEKLYFDALAYLKPHLPLEAKQRICKKTGAKRVSRYTAMELEDPES